MKNIKKKERNVFLYNIKTRSGQEFNPNKNTWYLQEISNKYTFYFDNLYIVNEHLYGIKRVFIWYLENYSFSYTVNLFRLLKELLYYIHKQSQRDIFTITSTHLLSYKSTLDSQHEWYLGALSAFLKKWYSMGFTVLSKDAYNFLLETTFKGAEKGRAVLTMDLQDGPFSDIEFDSIQTALNNAYAKDEITLSNFILIWLFILYGSRPIQLAQLKVCDLLALKRNDGSLEYIIKIPRVKNRKNARTEFKERIVPPSFGKLLFSYTQQIKINFSDIVKNTNNLPLFPRKKGTAFSHLEYHLRSDEIRYKIQKVINSLNIISERTGEKLHITPTRFRRTIGTRAASEGHGELIIAEILDHSDTQNAGIYVQSTPGTIKRIDKAIALQMAPIAQAFAGVLVLDKSSAKRANDPSSDIIDPNIDESCKAMGKCGSFGFCGLLSPLACYTCSSFQAWDDGPHEKLLLHLLKERERLMQTTDERIASINDRTIFAVAQVVDECNKLSLKNHTKVIS